VHYSFCLPFPPLGFLHGGFNRFAVAISTTTAGTTIAAAAAAVSVLAFLLILALILNTLLGGGSLLFWSLPPAFMFRFLGLSELSKFILWIPMEVNTSFTLSRQRSRNLNVALLL
jgi:hypothetical protein